MKEIKKAIGKAKKTGLPVMEESGEVLRFEQGHGIDVDKLGMAFGEITPSEYAIALESFIREYVKMLNLINQTQDTRAREFGVSHGTIKEVFNLVEYLKMIQVE